jgi:prevent-host-death family protein
MSRPDVRWRTVLLLLVVARGGGASRMGAKRLIQSTRLAVSADGKADKASKRRGVKTRIVGTTCIERSAMSKVSVTSAEFQKGFGRYREAALKKPVTITNHGRECLVLMAAEEYRRLKRRERRVMGLDDFTDADIAAVEASQAPLEAAAFNHEAND